MIGSLSQEKAQKVISTKREKSSDYMELTRKWRDGFIVLAVMTAGMIWLLIDAAINKTEHLYPIIIVTFVILLLDAAEIYNFLRSRVIIPGKYGASVDKYGKDELISQITSKDTLVFTAVDGITDNAVIITKDYLISTGEFICALDDIEYLTIRRRYVNPKEYRGYHISEYTRTIMRNMYSVRLVLKDGKTRNEYMAFEKGDVRVFLKTLKKRAPHITARWPDVEG